MRHFLPFLALLLLIGCSTVESTYDPASGYRRSSLARISGEFHITGPLRGELMRQGFALADAGAPAEFEIRLDVRRSWRGVIAGTVPGTVSLTVVHLPSGRIAATAFYDLGGASYTGTDSAARMIAEELASRVAP